ncbi:LysE family translocator [Pseudonocardiaceae bacterium YIM PH 21723]|nr:LysE family translocator [Pseudonocardiaceae bacterium YIM PH 21723]
MVNPHLLLGFTLAVIPICLTPGASVTLVTQRVLAGGRRDGLLVAAGTATGLCVHATLAALGLSAIVMRSAEAFTVIRLLGALYLVWLGISTLRATRKARRLPWTGHGAYVQALLGNVLNPKAAAVYLTLAPQFLDPQRPLLPQIGLLLAAHVLVAVGWLSIWTQVVAATRQVIGSDRFTVIMSRITGSVLVALGLRSAMPVA